MSNRQHWTGWLSVSIVAAVVAALAALALAVVPVGAQAGYVNLSASLSGADAIPPTSSSYNGTFSASMDLDSFDITYTIQSNATGITQAHIHVGAPGATGPVGGALFGTSFGNDDPASDGISVGGTLVEIVGDPFYKLRGDNILRGTAYVDIHLGNSDDVELRGQISVSEATATPAVLPSAGSAGLADIGASSAPIIAGAVAGLLVLVIGAGARSVVRRRA